MLSKFRVLSLALLAPIACSEAPVETIELAKPVVVRLVESVSFEEGLEATGELIAKDHATIASEVPGRITELAVQEGQRVAEGDLLLAIDPEKRELELRNSKAMLTETRASLSESERELARIRTLHGQQIASEQALDKAVTALALARSRLEAAEAGVGVASRALQDAQVRAPFGGLVAERMVSRGEYVQVGQALLDVVALDPIEVEFSVAERDSARVKEGLQVQVHVAPYPDEAFTGSVSAISPTIDSRTRTLRVKARIPNTDGRLRPGLFARAGLGVARREGVLMVPEEAVLLRAEGEIVYVATKDNRVDRIQVKTGVRRDHQIEILSGLTVGQEVVVRGHAALSAGTLVSRRTLDGEPVEPRGDRSELSVASDGSDFAAEEADGGAVVQ